MSSNNANRANGAKGKKTKPILSWNDERNVEDPITRSLRGLWGASKLAHYPESFIPNVLRPVAQAMAVSLPKHSPQAKTLQTFSNNNFRNTPLYPTKEQQGCLNATELDFDALREIADSHDDRAFCAHAIIRLIQGGEGYREPNKALVGKMGEVEVRGDRATIDFRIKQLASLAIGERAFMRPTHQTATNSQHAA